MAVLEHRALQALRQPANWIQLAKFGAVGVLGFAINLGIYYVLLKAGLWVHLAAAISFVISAASNYWWNRHWTFVDSKGHFGQQGARFFGVSVVAFGANQLWLTVFHDWLGVGSLVSQALAIMLVTPLNFLGNKLWSFKR